MGTVTKDGPITKAEKKEEVLNLRPPIYFNKGTVRSKWSFDIDPKILEEMRAIVLRYKALPNNWRAIEFEKFNLLPFACLGHRKMVKQILFENRNNSEVNINIQDKNCNNALILAIASGDKDTIEFLANYYKGDPERSINLNHLNNRKISALHLAVRKKNINMVKILLDAGADPNIKGQYGESPIFDAVRNSDWEMIDVLLNYNPNNKADIDFKNNFNETPLIAASIKDNYNDALEELLKNEKIDLIAIDINKKTCLMHACYPTSQQNMRSIVRKLRNLDEKTCCEIVNAEDEKGATVLMYLAKTGLDKRIKEIICLGGDPRVKDLTKEKKQAFDYVNRNKNNCANLLEIACIKFDRIIKIPGFHNRMGYLNKLMEKQHEIIVINPRKALAVEPSFEPSF